MSAKAANQQVGELHRQAALYLQVFDHHIGNENAPELQRKGLVVQHLAKVRDWIGRVAVTMKAPNFGAAGVQFMDSEKALEMRVSVIPGHAFR
ncbi:MAG: hypothetical protein EOR99_34080 [Mesorhizobium sp.]|nr:MAG: hypothetical protein EOR99_34080 [Mesorhizobium sp.]